MKTSTKIVLAVVAIAIVGIIIFNMRGAEAEPGKYDEFAKHLSEKGVTMYGAYWCPHCASQKKLFGSSFDYVNYVECDPRGNNAQPQLCESKGIEGFPTWEFPLENGETEMVSGELSLREIAFRSGYQGTIE